MQIKNALTTMALATVLLTSSISANELATEQTLQSSTQKVENIGAFDGVPTNNLNTTELEVVGEGWKKQALNTLIKFIKTHKKQIKSAVLEITDAFTIHKAY